MAQTNNLRKYKSLYSSTLSAGIGTGTGETITPASVVGLPTDTEITLTIDRVDSSGVATPTKMERITGTISGGNLVSYTRAVDGSTEQAHSAGAVIEMIWNADDWNDMINMLLVEHNDAGTHKSALVTTLKASGDEVTTGTDDTKIVTPKALTDAGVNITAASTTTFTNKRITKRVQSVTSAATVTPHSDNDDCVIITAQAEALTIANPAGTPTNLQPLVIRIIDNGTARAISFGDGFFASTDITLPTTTVLSKTMYLGFLFNSVRGKWDLIAKVDNF